MVVAVQTPEFIVGAVFIVVLDAIATMRLKPAGPHEYLRSSGLMVAIVLLLALLFSLLPADQARYGWIVFLVVGIARVVVTARRRPSP